MKRLPLVCKFTRCYTYGKRMKEKPLYALLLEYNPVRKAYYVNLFEESGKTYGRHYDQWLYWDDETIDKYKVPMEYLPDRLLKGVREQIAIFEEVNNRCQHKK